MSVVVTTQPAIRAAVLAAAAESPAFAGVRIIPDVVKSLADAWELGMAEHMELVLDLACVGYGADVLQAVRAAVAQNPSLRVTLILCNPSANAVEVRTVSEVLASLMTRLHAEPGLQDVTNAQDASRKDYWLARWQEAPFARLLFRARHTLKEALEAAQVPNIGLLLSLLQDAPTAADIGLFAAQSALPGASPGARRRFFERAMQRTGQATPSDLLAAFRLLLYVTARAHEPAWRPGFLARALHYGKPAHFREQVANRFGLSKAEVDVLDPDHCLEWVVAFCGRTDRPKLRDTAAALTYRYLRVPIPEAVVSVTLVLSVL